MNDNSFITVGQFVFELQKHRPSEQNTTEFTMHESMSSQECTLNYMHYAYHAGWLEDMDITGKAEPLLRKNAARIIHEFLRLELHEPDTEDISAVTKLRDLYDCRVCTKHIMQVVAKGIMEGYYITDTLCLFGLNEQITSEEAQAIIGRVYHIE